MPDVPADRAGLGSGEEVHVDGLAGLVVPSVPDAVSVQSEHVSRLGAGPGQSAQDAAPMLMRAWAGDQPREPTVADARVFVGQPAGGVIDSSATMLWSKMSTVRCARSTGRQVPLITGALRRGEDEHGQANRSSRNTDLHLPVVYRRTGCRQDGNGGGLSPLQRHKRGRGSGRVRAGAGRRAVPESQPRMRLGDQ